MVTTYNWLDIMAWVVASSAILLAILGLGFPQFLKGGSADDTEKSSRLSLGIGLGVSGHTFSSPAYS